MPSSLAKSKVVARRRGAWFVAFAALSVASLAAAGCGIGRATGQNDGDPGARCNTDRDCKTGLTCLSIGGSGFGAAGTCVGQTFANSGSCTDGAKNGDETDVDCGGSCNPCAVAQTCNGATDCASQSCNDGKVCDPGAACSNSVRDGSESDNDCGGPACNKCQDGRVCNAPTDCRSGLCASGKCVSCGDGVKNGTESDVDCGGSACVKCDFGQACSAPTDCKNGSCIGGICRDATCSDGVRNGTESDVDCGGLGCPACAFGKGCMSGADCQTQQCGMDGKCSDSGTVNVGNDIPFNPSGDPRVTPSGTGITLSGSDLARRLARYAWISNSAEGTVSKIDTQTQVEVARYCTYRGCNADPSRTTVSLAGNVAVVNRANYYGVSAPDRASVTKIAGDKSNCVDRNGNGVIDTYEGPGPIPAAFQWTAGQANSPDECVLWTTSLTRDRNNNVVGFPGTLPRAASFDFGSEQEPEQYLYIGLFQTQELLRLDARTGAILRYILLSDAAGGINPYGAVLDKQGRVWIRGGTLKMVDPAQADRVFTYNESACGYGITSDARGYIYTASSSCVARFDRSKATCLAAPNDNNCRGGNPWEQTNLPGACFARGLAVNKTNEVWVADTCSGFFRVDGSRPHGMGMTLTVGPILPRHPGNLAPTGNDFLGMAFDPDGFGIVVNEATDNQQGGPAFIHRINPANNTSLPIRVGRNPYMYSDFTGSQLFNVARRGTYRKNFATQCTNTVWRRVRVEVPAPVAPETSPPVDTSITVRYRAADAIADLDAATFVDAGVITGMTPMMANIVSYDVMLPSGMAPRKYLQVEVRLSSDNIDKDPVIKTLLADYTCQ